MLDHRCRSCHISSYLMIGHLIVAYRMLQKRPLNISFNVLKQNQRQRITFINYPNPSKLYSNAANFISIPQVLLQSLKFYSNPSTLFLYFNFISVLLFYSQPQTFSSPILICGKCFPRDADKRLVYIAARIRRQSIRLISLPAQLGCAEPTAACECQRALRYTIHCYLTWCYLFVLICLLKKGVR